MGDLNIAGVKCLVGHLARGGTARALRRFSLAVEVELDKKNSKDNYKKVLHDIRDGREHCHDGKDQCIDLLLFH